MKVRFYPSSTRGEVDHGWLKSFHSFSFAHFYDPARENFGLLRVLNDDTVEPSRGFDTHSHREMEIVSIPLRGSLRHKDSEGNETLIQENEVQMMSAGTGVSHSEYNASDRDEVNFLQIWVFPKEKGIQPRYEQKKFDSKKRENQWQEVVGPLGQSGSGVRINQDAWFYLADLSDNSSLSYQLHSKNHGVYVFLIQGKISVNETELNKKDALGLSQIQDLSVKSHEASTALLIEIPMDPS